MSMEQWETEARLALLNNIVLLFNQGKANQNELDYGMSWFKVNNIPVALQPVSGRYELVPEWPNGNTQTGQ